MYGVYRSEIDPTKNTSPYKTNTLITLVNSNGSEELSYFFFALNNSHQDSLMTQSQILRNKIIFR